MLVETVVREEVSNEMADLLRSMEASYKVIHISCDATSVSLLYPAASCRSYSVLTSGGSS